MWGVWGSKFFLMDNQHTENGGKVSFSADSFPKRTRGWGIRRSNEKEHLLYPCTE